MSASISHDIKNCLAIMNESVGLLKDYLAMGTRTGNFQPERLNHCSTQIAHQIQRADDLVKNLNQFGHSVDTIFGPIDLEPTLNLVIQLGKRYFSNHNVDVTLVPLPTPLTITTKPFQFKNLMWLCLEHVSTVLGDNKSICICLVPEDSGVKICFTQLTGVTHQFMSEFPSDNIKYLFNILHIKFQINDNPGEIILYAPFEINQSV